MVVSVFGLGYVGIVSASCFARDGINVIGVDVSEAKVDNINKGVSPIIETGLSDLLSNGIENGRIEATTALDEAIAKSEVSLISVGTPSREDGALDLSFVNKVCEDIAAEVSRTKDSHTIIIRSTVLPGTTEDIKQRLVSKYPNLKLSIGFNPEFLREGTAIKDFDEAPYTIIGTEDQQCVEYIKKLYATIDSPVIETKSSEAELVKYAANSWLATKIAFAN